MDKAYRPYPYDMDEETFRLKLDFEADSHKERFYKDVNREVCWKAPEKLYSIGIDNDNKAIVIEYDKDHLVNYKRQVYSYKSRYGEFNVSYFEVQYYFWKEEYCSYPFVHKEDAIKFISMFFNR